MTVTVSASSCEEEGVEDPFLGVSNVWVDTSCIGALGGFSYPASSVGLDRLGARVIEESNGGGSVGNGER